MLMYPMVPEAMPAPSSPMGAHKPRVDGCQFEVGLGDRNDGHSMSDEQHFYAVRMNALFARRPCEHRKTSILRRNERNRVVLIVDELRRRQMPCSAELGGRQRRGDAS